MKLTLRLRAAATTFAAVAFAAFAPTAGAQSWKPERTVTLVVPYAPGGGTDAQARHLARALERVWGQTVIVDNTAGADGLIGTRKVIDAKPDGYTLLVQLPSLTLIRHTPMFKGIDPTTQLVPASAFSSLAGVVAANPALPVTNMGELVHYCKTASPPCSVATTENIARLQAQVLVADAGLPNLIVANYKGGGQAITDLIANNVNFGLMGITSVLPHQRSGKMKVVMTMGHVRSSVLPDVPTAVESGFPMFDMVTWYGLFAPKGTPQNVVDGVAAAVREAVKADDFKKALATIGAEPVGNSPAEFAAMVQKDADRFGALAKRFPIE